MLALAAGAGLILDNARRLGLADAFARVGFYRFGYRELGRLAFRHGKEEYGVV